MSDPSTLLADPFVATELDVALAPYRSVLSATELAWLREQLADDLSSREELRRLLAEAYPRRIDDSGERVRTWLDTTMGELCAVGDDELGRKGGAGT